MFNNKLFLSTISLFLLTNCSHQPMERKISSIDDDFARDLEERYKIQEELRLLEQEKAQLHAQSRINASNAQEAYRQEKKLQAELESKEERLRQTATDLENKSKEYNKSFGNTSPEYFLSSTKLAFRSVDQTLELSDWDRYAANAGHFLKYPLDIHSAKEYRIKLSQKFNTSYAHLNDGQRYIWTEVTCDGPFKLKTAFINHTYPAGHREKFRFYNASKNSQRVTLTLSQDSGSCLMRFKDRDRDEHGISFIPESQVISEDLTRFQNQFEYCVLPDARGDNLVKKLFTTTNFESMTCPKKIDNITTLEDPIKGLQQKAKALLGTELPKKMMESKDPYYPLDFSRAPKLDAVYISYLVWRRDFYGTVMERLVRHHAEQGAQIKILVSDVISLDKDKAMLKRLSSDFPNVHVQFYKYDVASNSSLADFFSEFHRTMHVKLLLTYSKDEASANTAFFGGRNIHDGFIFNQQPDLSRYPELVQYGEDESFAKWTDFEIMIKDHQLVETLMGQFLALFEYDQKNLHFRSFTMTERAPRPLDPGYFEAGKKNYLYRHFISIPYRDDMALEKYMVELFDSAKKSITISTPYFNLTKELTAGIERAIARGVKIEVITRLDLKGDTADIILSDVNKKAVNKFVDNITVYEFTKPSDILHSKLVLIDGELTTVGSVNFNQRSFYHDIENTLVVYSPHFNQRIQKVLESYKVNTRVITETQKTALWKSLVIKVFNRAL